MFSIDNELKEFCESGVAVLIGTVDADGRPRANYAWGPRVHPGGQVISVYLERARSHAIVAARETHPQVAVTFTEPVSARSIQLKGRIVGIGEPNEAEDAWVARQRDAMTVATSLIGDPPHIIRNIWLDDTIRIDVSVERGFIQTPGPTAGQPLQSATAEGAAS